MNASAWGVHKPRAAARGRQFNSDEVQARGRRRPLEVVVHAAAENMGPDVTGEQPVQGADTCDYISDIERRDVAQIHVEVFSLGGPVAP